MNCFFTAVDLALCRTDANTQTATGAIFRSHLQEISQVLAAFPACSGRLQTFGRTDQLFRLDQLGAKGRVRTDGHALAALNAEVLIPNGDLQREVALLPFRSACRVGAVDG